MGHLGFPHGRRAYANWHKSEIWCEGYGLGLPGVYLLWILVVAALYLPCRWFAEVKRRRKDMWLRYL